MVTQWKPNKKEIEWARLMIRNVRNGGTMAMPSVHLAYKLNHSNKEIILTTPQVLRDPKAMVTHCRTLVTFEVLGYKVTYDA